MPQADSTARCEPDDVILTSGRTLASLPRGRQEPLTDPRDEIQAGDPVDLLAKRRHPRPVFLSESGGDD